MSVQSEPVMKGQNWSLSPDGVITILGATGRRASDGGMVICNTRQPKSHDTLIERFHVVNGAATIEPMMAVELFLEGVITLNHLRTAMQGARTIVCREVEIGVQTAKVTITSVGRVLHQKQYADRHAA